MLRALALLLVLPCAALAQERWELQGRGPGGEPVEVRLLLRRVDSGDLAAELRLRPAGGGTERRLEGAVSLRSRTRVEASLLPPGGAGLTGALLGERGPAAAPSALTLELTPPGPECRLRLVDPDGGQTLASGARRVDRPRPPARGLKGRLLAVGRFALDDVLGGRAELDLGVPLGDFLHLGLGTRVSLLHKDQLLPEQETALGQAPGATWVETQLEGGIRLPFELPLCGLVVGIKPGTALRYRVRELFPLAPGQDPEEVRRGLLGQARRAIDLPLTAREALAMPLGAEREVAGEMSLALSGGLGLGTTTAALGAVVEIGAQARAGGFWRVTAPLSIDVVRLEGQRVRLRWTRSTRQELGAEARAFLGVAGLDRGALEREAPALDYFQPAGAAAEAAVGCASALGLLRFEVKAKAARLREQELDLAWVFDLSRPAAREAYERAVRGDLTAAGRHAGDPGTGVHQELRVLEHEERTWLEAELALSELARAKASRALSVKDLAIEDAAGSHAVDVVRAERRSGRDFVFGLVPGARREASLELASARDPRGGAPTRTLRWQLVVRDPRTGLSDLGRLRRLVERWGLPEAEVAVPERRLLRSRFGCTRTLLQVDVSAAGVEELLAAPEAMLRRAWCRAAALVEGQDPEAAEGQGGEGAATFAAAVGRLRGDRASLAEGVGDLSRLAGDEPILGAAILEVVSPGSVRLRAEVDGRRLDYDGERRGERYSPGRALHGH